MFKLYNDADIEKINVVCDRGRSLMYNMKLEKKYLNLHSL